MDNELQIAMSPVHLAAVLSDKSVTESEGMSNRLMGGLDQLMGSLELAGATALCMAPEPTGITKAACIVVGAHSMDSINAAANRVRPARIPELPPTRRLLLSQRNLALTTQQHGISVWL